MHKLVRPWLPRVKGANGCGFPTISRVNYSLSTMPEGVSLILLYLLRSCCKNCCLRFNQLLGGQFLHNTLRTVGDF